MTGRAGNGATEWVGEAAVPWTLRRPRNAGGRCGEPQRGNDLPVLVEADEFRHACAKSGSRSGRRSARWARYSGKSCCKEPHRPDGARGDERGSSQNGSVGEMDGELADL